MRKIILFAFMLMLLGIWAQNWTPEAQLILNRVNEGWSSQQDAVNNNDPSIWFDKVKPISIKVFDDVAFIWFYASYAEEYKDGSRVTFEEKRFEVYRKIDELWRWSDGMIVTYPLDF